MSYKPWPEKNKPANFSEIAEPIINAINIAYRLERRNEHEDIPWDGLDIGDDIKVTCFSPKEQLSAQNLRYSLEDQGRTAMEEIVGLAIQLGMEQGRRKLLEETETWRLLVRASLHTLNDSLRHLNMG